MTIARIHGLVLMMAVAVLAGMVAATAPARAAACNDRDLQYFVPAGKLGCLAVNRFGPTNAETLLVLLHGDLSSGGPVDYLQGLARDLASSRQGLATAVLMRPGYGDGDGHISDGATNDRRDHYTPDAANAIAEALRTLRSRTGAMRLVVLGHSGGANLAGVILGRTPGLIDRAMLVSCPCDVARWRQDRGRGPWPNSLSAIDQVKTIPRRTGDAPTRVVVVTGQNDTNTPPALGRDYHQALEAAGIAGSFVEIPGAGHGFNAIANSPVFKAALAGLLDGAPPAAGSAADPASGTAG